MPKRKYIPQPELNEITDQEWLMERQVVLECLHSDRFSYIKTYKDSDEYKFTDINHILSRASKREQIFIKNYFMLPDQLRADFEINKSALKKNPHIYFLIDHDFYYENAVAYAETLMQTDGSYFEYIQPNLVERNLSIAFNAVKSRPINFKDLPAKYTDDENFIEMCLKANPLTYCQLSSSQRKDINYLSIIYKYTQPQDIPKIYQALPQKLKVLKENILEIIKFWPQVYGLLSHKHRADEQIAVFALNCDYKQIANIPRGMHFKLPIIDAYISRKNLKKVAIGNLIYEFKSLTNRNITNSDLVEKIIAIFPKHKMKFFAEAFGSMSPHNYLLNSKNMTKLLKKNPQAFSRLQQLHELYGGLYSDIIELGIKLDYKNFQYISFNNYSEHEKKYYEDLLMLAVKTYQASESKDAHPFKYASDAKITPKRLKQIITYRVDGKVIVDYVNIFRHGSPSIKRSRRIYVNALNINPGLAAHYPVTKNCKDTIFKGLNLEARKALYPPWIQKQGPKDVLEIAHLKKEILEPLTTNDTKKD